MIPPWVKVVSGLAAAAALVWGVRGYLSSVEESGRVAGAAAVRIEWKDAEEKAQEAAKNDRGALIAAADVEAGKRRAAEREADDYRVKWEAGKADAKRRNVPLAHLTCPGEGLPVPGRGAMPAGDATLADDPAPRLRLSWEFVQLYNDAYPGPDGKPLLGDSPGSARAPADAPASGPSPVDLDRLLDVHGENARRHAACIRDFTALIRAVERLRGEWDQRAK